MAARIREVEAREQVKWENVLKFAIATLFFLYSVNVMVNQLRRKFE